MKKKLLTAVLGGTAVATLAFASASLLSVDGGTLQAGSDGTLSCDSDGVTVNWGLETTDNSVRGVRITNINPACAGAEMFVKTNVTVGDAEVVVLDNTGTARVSFPAPYPTPESIEAIKIWIEG